LPSSPSAADTSPVGTPPQVRFASPSMAEETRSIHGGGGEGILLYCKYATVSDVSALVRLYETNCLSLGLRGRVWIGPDGVNVTVRGELSSLENHTAAMRSHSLFEGTDFKLVSCDAPADEGIAREYGFAFLSVRVVKFDVLTFDSYLVESRGIWNNFPMVDFLRERTLFLTTGEWSQLEARMQLLLGHACNVVLPLMTIQHNAAVDTVGFWFWCAIVASHDLQPSLFTGTGPSKKLRILCLHGFRQNSSGFKGRTGSLAKKLKKIADFIFVDAPHELPFIYHPQSIEQSSAPVDPSTMEVAACSDRQPPPPCQSCKKKFAWLVSPTSSWGQGTDWKVADQPFDPLQYQQQTEGFQESYMLLKQVFSQMGPFDGILGFSQGAAMAGLVCDEQWRVGSLPDFRFAILCSGFSLLPEERNHSPIKCPSLHIYGSSRGRDRQIACQASIELASKFDEGCSMVIEHDMGHIIPTQPPYIDQIRAFLSNFLSV
ncbi:hypothetical protein Taro_020790, partial [Colocasia esculenta]|nr:hypothetical protein [Colocasia esculenta]